MSEPAPTPADTDSAAGIFAEKISSHVISGFEALALYVGDRLGLYRELALSGPCTPAGLAARVGMQPRYAKEWLEQQAVSGILELAQQADGTTRFWLPAAHAEVLTDSRSLTYTAPAARMLVAAASRLPDLLRAYQAGGGVEWSQFGADARDAQGDINRPWFESALGAALAGVSEVHEVLSRPGARIADIGCGHGWSTIALARAYPQAHLEGIDVDEPSLEAARTHAADMPTVSFALADGEDIARSGAERFDACLIFEALHDMPHPVDVLRSIRRAVREDGVVIVMDEAVAEELAANGDEIERTMYAYSLFICLPDSMSTSGSAATGTVMRPATLARYAQDAGFTGVQTLPIERFSAFRFYRLLI